jgi:hypothetical protein
VAAGGLVELTTPDAGLDVLGHLDIHQPQRSRVERLHHSHTGRLGIGYDTGYRPCAWCCGSAILHVRASPGYANDEAFLPEDFKRVVHRAHGDTELLAKGLRGWQWCARRELAAQDSIPQQVGELPVCRHPGQRIDGHDRHIMYMPRSARLLELI